MDLTKKDVAELLTLSMHTVDRLIVEGNLPCYKLEGEWRFNRQEIESWMVKTLGREKEVIPFGEGFSSSGPWHKFGLYRAIHKGEVLKINTSSLAKEEIIKQAMSRVAGKLSLDPEMVSEMLIEREKLTPTAIGSGIAVPHTREFLLRGLVDAVVVVYLSNPVDWGAMDGQPVDTLFFLFGCDDKRHLNLLAKIAHFSSNLKNVELLKQQVPKNILLEEMREWEDSILAHEPALI